MKRTLVAITIALSSFAVLAHPAAADDPAPTTLPPVTFCPGWNPPMAPPCLPPTIPTTLPPVVDTHYCLGYGQSFPKDMPCPRPPDDGCVLEPKPIDCDPTYNPTPPVPDAGIGHPVDTTPPTSAPVPGSVTISATTVRPGHNVAPAATQRRSGPSRTHRAVTTTTTQQPPLFFALGQWMTWDEFVAFATLQMGH